MQTAKLLLTLCVVALGAGVLQAQRIDTEEQAKARELLRKKMVELDAQQPAAPAQQPAQPTPAPVKKPKAKKAASKPAPVVEPTPSQPSPARGVSSAPPLTPPAKSAPPKAATPPTAAPPAAASGSASAFAPVAPTGGLSPEDEVKARRVLRQQTAEDGATPGASSSSAASQPVPKVSSTAAKKGNKGPNVFATTPPASSPIPLAIPSAKEQKLSELLTRYRANAVTPEEYHKKRAEILAQP